MKSLRDCHAGFFLCVSRSAVEQNSVDKIKIGRIVQKSGLFAMHKYGIIKDHARM
jgi:hypothetical protein